MREKESWIEQTKRYNSKVDTMKFFLLFIPACVLLILILLAYIFQWEWPDWVGFVAGYAVFGGIIVGSTIGYIKSKIKYSKAVTEDAIVVTGTIIAHYSNNVTRKYKTLYYPVYEYIVNGKKYELISNIDTCEAFCVSDMRMQGRFYLIFAAVGILTVALVTNSLLRFY